MLNSSPAYTKITPVIGLFKTRAPRGIQSLRLQYRLSLLFSCVKKIAGNLFESHVKCLPDCLLPGALIKNGTHRSECSFLKSAPGGMIRSRVTKYNYSLRSNSTKYSRPRLGCRTRFAPCDMPAPFESLTQDILMSCSGVQN